MDVGAEGFEDALGHEQRRAEDDDEDEQQHGHDDIEVRQDLDAFVEAERDRDRGQPADDADDDQLPQGVLRNADDLSESAVDLQRAQTDRDGDAEDGADDGDDVDGLADGTVDLLTEDGLEDRAHPRRQVPFVDEVGEAQRGQGEDRPGVQGEVVVGEVHGIDRGGGRSRFDTEGSARWVAEVADGFSDTPEHEDRADAGGEEHGEPGAVGVLRRFVIGTEFRSPIPGGGDVDEECDEDCDTEDVEPSEVRQQPIRGDRDARVELVGEEDRPEDEDDNHGRRGEEYGRVGSESKCVVQLNEHGVPSVGMLPSTLQKHQLISTQSLVTDSPHCTHGHPLAEAALPYVRPVHLRYPEVRIQRDGARTLMGSGTVSSASGSSFAGGGGVSVFRHVWLSTVVERIHPSVVLNVWVSRAAAVRTRVVILG